MQALRRRKDVGGDRWLRQRGVALAMLLWFLAAMSLLVGGLVMQARVDVKLAQLHAVQARIEAAADGAIELAMARMLVPADPAGPPLAQQRMQFTLGGMDVTVLITPLSGLININQAPQELLQLLFASVPGLDEGAAEELAANVVEWRSASLAVDAGDAGTEQGTGAGATAGVRHGRFEANEDLLLVAGFDRRIYEAVQDAIYVSQEGQTGVDWLSAPFSVLRVLLGGDTDAALAVVEARMTNAEQGLVAPVNMNLTFQETTMGASYRIDALVQYDESVFCRRRWVNREQAGSDGLPWSFYRSEALRVVSSAARDAAMLAGGVYAGS